MRIVKCSSKNKYLAVSPIVRFRQYYLYRLNFVLVFKVVILYIKLIDERSGIYDVLFYDFVFFVANEVLVLIK